MLIVISMAVLFDTCSSTWQVLTREYYGLQTSLEKRIVELESTVSEKKSKLEAYEKLEQDLDAVIMQAAEGIKFSCLKSLSVSFV